MAKSFGGEASEPKIPKIKHTDNKIINRLQYKENRNFGYPYKEVNEPLGGYDFGGQSAQYKQVVDEDTLQPHSIGGVKGLNLGPAFDTLFKPYEPLFEAPRFRVENTDPSAVLRAGDMATKRVEVNYWDSPSMASVSRYAIVQAGARLDQGADKLEPDLHSVVVLMQTVTPKSIYDDATATEAGFRDAEIHVVTLSIGELAAKGLVFERPSNLE